MVPKGNSISSNTDDRGGGNTGQTYALGIASGGGGASNRHGGIVVPKDGPRSIGDENDRISATDGSIFYKISYNVYG